MHGKKHAIFPFVMTIVSFLLFIPAYLIVTIHAINPYYLAGLIFALPSICFGAITVLAIKNKLGSVVTSITTGILIPIFAILMFFVVAFMTINSATEVTTDAAKYEAVLASTSKYNNLLTKSFPKQIPQNASNIKLYYSPAFLQGGEDFVLQFKTDSKSIANYKAKFSKQSEKFRNSINTPPDFNYENLKDRTFMLLGYNQTPPGYFGYLLYSTSNFDWNHGDCSFVAINSSLNTIIFVEYAG